MLDVCFIVYLDKMTAVLLRYILSDYWKTRETVIQSLCLVSDAFSAD